MFDRVNDISDTLTGGSESGDVDPGELPSVLRDDEELVHVLANGGSLEHTKEGRTTTVEPSGNEDAYMLVTDERILYILGDQPDEPEIEIPMTDFNTVHVRKGLLNSKLLVKTFDEEVLFNPDEGDLEATADYIDRVASCWSGMEGSLQGARSVVAEFEEAVRSGDHKGDRFLDARSKISEARRSATKDDDAPSEKIRAVVDEAAAEIERRHVEAWVDHAEDRSKAIAPAMDDGRYDEACEAYVDAVDAIEKARDGLEKVDIDTADIEERIDTLDESVRATGGEFLAETDAECERAVSTAEPADAIDAWEDAFDRYSAAVDAGWNGQAPVSGNSIEYQLTWVTSSLLDALESHASLLESRADDCEDDDEATEYYDDAIVWFERATTVAADHPERPAEEFEDAADRVEEKKLERSGWEFGNAT